jgi:hypothetical protein
MSKEQTNDVAIEATEAHEEHALICPRCNKNLSQPELTVSEDVRKEYTRCLLGQRPFTKTLTLLDGALQVTFESMSAEQAELFRTVMADAEIERAIDAKLLATLKTIKVIDKEVQTSVDTYMADYNTRLGFCKSMPPAITEVLKNIDAPMLGILRKCTVTFDLLCMTIREDVFAGDFYEGIGLL